MKEDCSQKGSGYLALIYNKNKNEIRMLPVKNWITFHKNVKYLDEEEYNLKVEQAEAEFKRLIKGNKGMKKPLKKKEDSEHEEDIKENKSDVGKGITLGVMKEQLLFL